MTPALIGQACAAAERARDRGVGLGFAMTDMAAALDAERDPAAGHRPVARHERGQHLPAGAGPARCGWRAGDRRTVVTRRDNGWRVAGALLFAGACVVASLDPAAPGWVIFPFAAAFAGLVLMLHGRRVAVMLRAERSGHAVRSRSGRRNADLATPRGE
ncbi:hypothetical protein ACT009_13840 [Sphingomonas sp. Tas61C01]|uniref:hypothetical protein n=1 Tax=Sphingomonas sp. Tas61C01 TaxID=3458297 RepID=UPI00403EC5B6